MRRWRREGLRSAPRWRTTTGSASRRSCRSRVRSRPMTVTARSGSAAYPFDLSIPGGQLLRRRHMGRRAPVTGAAASSATSCAASSRTSAAGASLSRRCGPPSRRSTAGSATARRAGVRRSRTEAVSAEDDHPRRVGQAHRRRRGLPVPSVYDRVRPCAGMLSRSETWWKELRLADSKEWRRGASQKFYGVVESTACPRVPTYQVKNEGRRTACRAARYTSSR